MNVFKIRKVKRLALESIASAMEAIQVNLDTFGEEEAIEANSKAMKRLAEAFKIVKNA